MKPVSLFLLAVYLMLVQAEDFAGRTFGFGQSHSALQHAHHGHGLPPAVTSTKLSMCISTIHPAVRAAWCRYCARCIKRAHGPSPDVPRRQGSREHPGTHCAAEV
ncbi:hypothetical protein MRX96_054384 [Rhipicephalus microplus]